MDGGSPRSAKRGASAKVDGAMTVTGTRRTVFGLLAAPPILSTPHLWAPVQQSLPGVFSVKTSPRRILVPLPPGSSPDIAARLFAEAFSRRRSHPIAVENKVGGGGAVAGQAFTHTRSGEALFFGMSDLLTVAPLTQDRSPFADPAAFVPLSRVATDPMAVVVPASLPVRSLGELIDYARARPGVLNWYAAPGTSLYIAFNAFLQRLGIDAVFVSFAGLMLLELARGRVHLALGSIAASLPYFQSGSVRPLAVSSPSRAPVVPDLPTSAEAGFPDLMVEGVHGLFGWRGMADTVREGLSSDARAVLADRELIERYAAVGLQARGSTPTAFAAELANHRVRWAALEREFGGMPKQ
jgi:tripartite-type tricarboxylate transporter receptor subunit TctC